MDAFWSVTIYDTVRGGFLHPNEHNRYHINGINAVKNDDGTISFTFQTSCGGADRNCLGVPEGPFDLTMRYDLPSQEIQSVAWSMPKATLR